MWFGEYNESGNALQFIGLPNNVDMYIIMLRMITQYSGVLPFNLKLILVPLLLAQMLLRCGRLFCSCWNHR